MGGHGKGKRIKNTVLEGHGKEKKIKNSFLEKCYFIFEEIYIP